MLTLQYSWIGEILNLKSHVFMLKSSSLSDFQLVLVLTNPVSDLLAVMATKTTEADEMKKKKK